MLVYGRSQDPARGVERPCVSAFGNSGGSPITLAVSLRREIIAAANHRMTNGGPGPFHGSRPRQVRPMVGLVKLATFWFRPVV